jgi:hypothetical protein
MDSVSSETNAQLIAPSFDITHAPFFPSMNVDVRRNLKNMKFCSPRRQRSGNFEPNQVDSDNPYC